MTSAVRWWRVRWVFVSVGVLLVVYVGSYAALYRGGVREAERHGYDYFFYVPFADIVEARGTTRRHEILGPVYSPLNELHRQFGGRSACRCIMFGLDS